MELESRYRLSENLEEGSEDILRKRLALALGMLSVLLLCSTTLASSLAADYTKVGVKTGDTAEYSYSETGMTANRLIIRVLNVTAPTVKLNHTLYFPNGTIAYSAVANYNVSHFVQYFALIAANLAPGDKFCAGRTEMINDTATMTAAGVSRTVNHLKYHGGEFEAYWDIATGLLIKLNTVTSPEWMNLTLTATTVWSAGLPTTTLLLIAGAVIVIIASAAVLLRRRRK